MILVRHKLEELVKNGVITNITMDLMNPASIDITLGKEIFTETICEKTIEINKTGMEMQKVDISNGYTLYPGEFILGCSEQKFFIPRNISAEFKMKSTAGRCGLSHMMAGWCDPGWHNSVLTMELKNMTNYTRIILKPGIRIGQVVFFQHEEVHEEHLYKGRYNNDSSVEGAKVFTGEK